jgi:hypothetical protein
MSNDLVHPDAESVGMVWDWRSPLRGEHFRRCGWCGSIHPEDLIAETDWHADWADMKYGWPHKFYVDIPNRTPGEMYVIGATSGPGATETPGYIAWDDLTWRQRRIVKRDGWDPGKDDRWAKAFKFGTRSMHHAKFYTAHLADPMLSPATKLKIEKVCGRTFEFNGHGHVMWRPTGE